MTFLELVKLLRNTVNAEDVLELDEDLIEKSETSSRGVCCRGNWRISWPGAQSLLFGSSLFCHLYSCMNVGLSIGCRAGNEASPHPEFATAGFGRVLDSASTEEFGVKTLVLGIGNPILGDDGVGFHIVQELAKEIKSENIDIRDTSAGGLNLLDIIVGYERLILIDAVLVDEEEVGKIFRLRLEDVVESSRLPISPHHYNISTTIELGRRLFPGEIPREITVFAVGIRRVAQVTEEMSARVKEAIPNVIRLILEEESWLNSMSGQK